MVMAVTRVFLMIISVTLFFPLFVLASNGQSKLTEGETSSRTGPQHEDQQAQSAFPEQHVEAIEGSSAFLNCPVDNRISVKTLTVQWSKDGVKALVHLYKHRKDQVDDQDEEFRGKTTLNYEDLKRGTVTLELHSVQLSNSGRYVCYIPKLNYHCYINLTIVSNGTNNMTKGENVSTTGPPDRDNKGHPNRSAGRVIVLSVVFFIFFVCIIILIALALRHKANKSKMKRTDEENQLMPPKTNNQGPPASPSSSTPEISINQASAPHLVTHTDTHG